MGSKHLILSLDGGGIRGAFTIRVIQRIDEATGFLKNVKLVAGASTGGIEALGLALGLSPKDIYDLYDKKGKEIFKHRDRLDRFTRLDELSRADYDTKNLYKVLKETYGSATLRDLKLKVLIPTFDLDKKFKDGTPRRWGAKFFHNFSDGDLDLEVAELGTRTAAAPTYFGSRSNFVDGGLVANSPSIHAAAKCRKEGVADEDIHILSVGTGVSPTRYSGDYDEGLLWWAKKILPAVLDGQVGVSDYLCDQFYGDRYKRVNVFTKDLIDLDDVDSIDELKSLADHLDLSSTIDWLKEKDLVR